MNEVTLVFDSEGNTQQVHCERLALAADAVKVGDYIMCPHVGSVHVHETHTESRITYLEDCYGFEHMYRHDEILDVARPLDGVGSGC